MIAIQCACQGCSTPVARVVDGHLVLRGRHHGEQHQTRIPIAALTEYLREQLRNSPETG